MKPEGWGLLEQIYQSALEQPAENRAAFVARACGGDESLRREVESLLEQGTDDFLNAPAWESAARAWAASATGGESGMSLAAGERLGPYEITTKIGAGGMGEVYRARDTRLRREVAIKVSTERFSDRFEREARSIAALNHPSICTLYDVGPNYLVMELVEGPTLADRIAQGGRQIAGLRKGPLPLEEALAIARQIADALDAAHEKGIVHRDLKPANIKIKPDGTVKVLDFGLAKVTESSDAGPLPEDSPTLTPEAATRTGTILGTAAYMSPEQARGKAADKRTDIWSFGAVLYEMLSGQRAFGGESSSDILAAVLKVDPDWSLLPNKTPAAIRGLIRRCLTKDRRQRLQAIGDARIVIEECLSGAVPEMRETAPVRRSIVPWAAAAVLAIIAVAASWIAWRATRSPNRPLVRLDVDLGPRFAVPGFRLASHNVILSPDGARLVYVSRNPQRLYTRRLDQSKAAELLGADNPDWPFFSPDGQWVGFFVSGGKLSKISVQGGAVVPLADVGPYAGGSWGADGNIIIGGAINGLVRVPASGGAPTTILEVAPGDSEYMLPQILPGGKAVLFENRTQDRNTDSIEVFSFADRRRKTVVRGGANPYYLPSGHLIYTKSATLFAIPFDLHRLETRGAAVPILDDLAYLSLTGGVDLHFAQNGAVVYRSGGAIGASEMRTIQWIDGAGKREPLLAKPGDYCCPVISPDGKRLVLIGDQNVWVYDLQRDAMTRLTFEGENTTPAWSPDGKYVVFSETRKGIYWTRADGAGQPQPLTRSKNIQFGASLTPDGKRLAYQENAGKYQIWTLPMEAQDGQWKAGKPEQFLKDQFNDAVPAFSPDGHWLAYLSDASGKYEVYVRAFPPPASGQAGQWQISNNGARGPVWSRNGRELFYGSGDQLMAVSYSVNGNSFVAEKPRVWIDKLGGNWWDLAPDGKRVAVVTPVTSTETPKPDHEVVLLLNFFDELRRRVPVK
jgi:serine/threonine protein kinase